MRNQFLVFQLFITVISTQQNVKVTDLNFAFPAYPQHNARGHFKRWFYKGTYLNTGSLQGTIRIRANSWTTIGGKTESHSEVVTVQPEFLQDTYFDRHLRVKVPQILYKKDEDNCTIYSVGEPVFEDEQPEWTHGFCFKNYSVISSINRLVIDIECNCDVKGITSDNCNPVIPGTRLYNDHYPVQLNKFLHDGEDDDGFYYFELYKYSLTIYGERLNCNWDYGHEPGLGGDRDRLSKLSYFERSFYKCKMNKYEWLHTRNWGNETVHKGLCGCSNNACYSSRDSGGGGKTNYEIGIQDSNEQNNILEIRSELEALKTRVDEQSPFNELAYKTAMVVLRSVMERDKWVLGEVMGEPFLTKFEDGKLSVDYVLSQTEIRRCPLNYSSVDLFTWSDCSILKHDKIFPVVPGSYNQYLKENWELVQSGNESDTDPESSVTYDLNQIWDIYRFLKHVISDGYISDPSLRFMFWATVSTIIVQFLMLIMWIIFLCYYCKDKRSGF